MGEMNKVSKGKSLPEIDISNILPPKPETEDFELEFETSNRIRLDGASSSGSNVRSVLIGMGFAPHLVDRVIEEKGAADIDLLLEALLGYSDHQRSKSHSSGFNDMQLVVRDAKSQSSGFNDRQLIVRDSIFPPNFAGIIVPKKEPDVFEFDEKSERDEKRNSLLNMNFSASEVESALDKLGLEASIDELVDHILAARIAETDDVDGSDSDDCLISDNKDKKDVSHETLYSTMEKTLSLLQMGFTENEVSSAIDYLSSDAAVSELAEAICAQQLGEVYVRKEKPKIQKTVKFSQGIKDKPIHGLNGGVKIKTEDIESINAVARSRIVSVQEKLKGKRPKVGFNEVSGNTNIENSSKGKRPKLDDHAAPRYSIDLIVKEDPDDPRFTTPRVVGRNLDPKVAKPPYFIYGNVAATSSIGWGKVSKFTYNIEPEYVDTRWFSALSRKEGYIHNLPTENRFHILPRPPMTILDALPDTKVCFPSWDTRRHLLHINTETEGLSQICERLGDMLNRSQGYLSFEQKREVLGYCEALNLTWMAPNKLGPIEPDYIEHILGYPINHTQALGGSTKERLQALKNSFQIDTLAYQLSVLKPMYPDGVTLLSIFSGLGGAEIACERLGIELKGVISVETCETKQKVLKSWWVSSKQTGQLEQIDDINLITTNKIEKLLDKFGGIDLIVCQNAFSENAKKVKPGPLETPNAFDFTLYYEFCRVLQRIRDAMERRR